MKKERIYPLCHAIFWLWNCTFLLVVYGLMLPTIGIPIIGAALNGEIESQFLVALVALIGIPTICTIMGWRYLRRQPIELMRLFYGVEAPLFLLCLLRLFILRELTPASTLMLGTLIACTLAFLIELLQGYNRSNPILAGLQLVAHSLMLLTGIYIGLLLLFYVVPFAAFLLQELLKFYWLEGIWNSIGYIALGILLSILYILPIFLILFSLVSIGSSLFMPSALTSLYLHSAGRVFRAFALQYGRNRALMVAIATISAWLIIFTLLGQQPQVKAFELLEQPAKTTSERQEILANSEVIRTGLLNAYLSSYRYLSPRKDSNQILAIYRSVFDFPEPVYQFLQDSYNQLISPFLYNGSDSDFKKAEKLYPQIFDAPIQKAEAKAVQKALQSTAIIDQAKAGVLNINQKKVWLKSQQVKVDPHGDWADVEIYEVYENQTNDVEEILYYFSLPESSAITGLWLGDSDNRTRRFPFKVAPRGAAQKVYNSQVRRVRPVDPALLEQVGPRQYRLRAFPVPPPLSTSEKIRSADRPTQMHLWLTYKTMRQGDYWPMPQLGEKRNIFWTKNTKRIRNGEVVAGSTEDWLPTSLKATAQQQSKSYQVDFPEGYRISAKPLNECKDKRCGISKLTGKRFAVIVDSSYSMTAKAKELKDTFNWLKKQGFADNRLTNNDADVYLSSSLKLLSQRLDDLRKFNPAKVTFYGTLQIKDMLRQFALLQGDTVYDGIIVVTDEGSYELSDKSKDLPELSAPLWIVHLGSLAPAYDDATLKAIQDSGGGVATELPELLERMTQKAALGASVVSVADGYVWSIENLETPATESNLSESSGFEPLAARQLVLGLSKETGTKQLAQLDAIHAIAKTHKIVTPYSSMIVLVNDQQREALRQAEADANRFKRSVENGKEQLNRPNNPLNRLNRSNNQVSIPEPGMVIGLVAIALILLAKRQTGNRSITRWR